MTEYLPDGEVIELIRYVDDINLKHGAPKEITNPNTKEVYEIEKKGIAVGLKLLKSEQIKFKYLLNFIFNKRLLLI